MTHLLVKQLRFTRQELVRGLQGVTEEEAQRRFGPMNCISWIVGHLANQEQRYWLQKAQNKKLFPGLNERVGYGSPASTPSLAEMWQIWNEVTREADVYLDTLNPLSLKGYVNQSEEQIMLDESIGTLLMRVTYHYWYHTGEALAIRQMLGHRDLPQFVGDINLSPYFPEL